MAALNLLYAATPQDRNASGLDAVLVDAVDEAAARTAAIAATPNGETKVPTTWTYVLLAAIAAGLPDSRTVVWIEGPMASLIGKTRGGANLGIQ
jgi:hypothetical protein